jgi:ATP-dependent protease ClpP protease subunit
MSKNEIFLYGSVGNHWWDEEFFTASQVRQQLDGRTGPLTVHINSGGGIASEGQAIYTLLRSYPDQVSIIIEGAAMSAASLIAMAGDTITMTLGSFMLIHDPAALWTEGRGTEEDHLKIASQLSITANAYAAIYAKRSGTTRDRAREVMRAETLLDGEMAVAEGYATAVDEDAPAIAAARFDYRLYRNAPAAWRDACEGMGDVPRQQAAMAMIAGKPRFKKEKSTMEKTAIKALADDSAEPPRPTTPAAAEPAVAQETNAAVMAERLRGQRIRQAVMVARLPVTFADELIASGATEAVAIDKITAKWQEGGDVDKPTRRAEPTRIIADGRDKFMEGATRALLAKTRLKGGERNEFSSMSLKELARETIIMAGGPSRFADQREMVGHAFTMVGSHSTSDFARILSNIQGKAALQGWEEAPETFEEWTRKGTLTDFKTSSRTGLGLYSALRQVREGADYEYLTMGDRAEPILLATYGGMMRISRQAIINDDLALLGDTPRKMGRAARATIGDLAYAVLTANANMSDGSPLFFAGGNNLATGAPSALQVTSLTTARAAMRTQREGTRVLNVVPKYLIVPAALETTADALLNSTVDPRVNQGHSKNPVGGMAKIIVEPRLDIASVTAWYLAADPTMFDTIEVAYLDGNDTPYIEEQTGWTSDGVEMKVRIDATAAPLERRTLYRAVGA